MDELDGERKGCKVGQNNGKTKQNPQSSSVPPFFFAQTNTQQAPGVDRERRREMVHQCKLEREKIKGGVR